MSDHDLGERLRALGLRVHHDALAAFLAHVHTSRLSPTGPTGPTGPTETLES